MAKFSVDNDDEIWLVQVPNDLDLASAKVVSESEIHIGAAQYSLKPSDLPVSNCRILVPKEDHFTALKYKPTKLMSLYRSISVPEIDYDAVYEAKPTVPQQENLQTRHFPTGYANLDSAKRRRLSDTIQSATSHSKDKKDKKEKKDKKVKKEKSKKVKH